MGLRYDYLKIYPLRSSIDFFYQILFISCCNSYLVLGIILYSIGFFSLFIGARDLAIAFLGAGFILTIIASLVRKYGESYIWNKDKGNREKRKV